MSALDTEGSLLSLYRANAYGLAARTLSGPEGALNKALYQEWAVALREVPSLAGLAPAVEAILASLDGTTPRAVTHEHTELFLKAGAAPYEGSYLPSTRATQELADVSGFFLAFGVQARGERADHLVAELELLALLCLKESVARANGEEEHAALCRDAQAKFLADHLGRWVPLYAERVRERARLPLYPAVVDVVRRLVAIDAEGLGIRPEQIQEVPKDEPKDVPACGVAG